MQQNELWQEWNHYLLGRVEQFSHSISELCFESNAKLYHLFEEEIQRGIYEWYALHFRKVMSGWGQAFMVSMPNYTNSLK